VAARPSEQATQLHSHALVHAQDDNARSGNQCIKGNEGVEKLFEGRKTPFAKRKINHLDAFLVGERGIWRSFSTPSNRFDAGQARPDDLLDTEAVRAVGSVRAGRYPGVGPSFWISRNSTRKRQHAPRFVWVTKDDSPATYAGRFAGQQRRKLC